MFRTELKIQGPNEKINHKTPVLTIGSCFSDCMGNRFQANKFDVLSNPFGTCYNPLSIFKLLETALANHPAEAEGYVQTQGLWAHHDFHSSFSSVEKSVLEHNIHAAISSTHSFLKKTRWLIITFGTAIVYEHNETETWVNNCHKLPAHIFTKSMLSPMDIIESFEDVYKELSAHIPDLNIILTVSPVRHTKEGIENNAVSKSILRLAAYELQQYDNVHYFPGYEIMLDDLRDYRFYKSDMIHPNEDAEKYIWNKFSEAFFENKTKELIKDWQKILRAINHHPFNVKSDQHQKFLKETIARINTMQGSFDVSKEIELLKAQIV